MHLAFVVQPAYGHVIPTLPLVKELVRRGHQVSYGTGPELVPIVEKAGAEGVPLPTELPAMPPDRQTFLAKGFAELTRHALNDARRHFPVLHGYFERSRPDAVCYDMLTFTGHMLVETIGVPGIALVPNFAANERFSLADDTMGEDFGHADPVMVDLLRQRTAFAAGYGVTADLDALGGKAVAELNLVFMPREFQLAADTFDDRFRFLGPMLGRLETAEPWEPDPGDASTVFISLGTAFNTDVTFYRKCFEAFRDTRWQVAMAVGHRIDMADLGEIPANFDVRPRLPQHDVLRSASVHISHTGMNSTMESLAFGVPLVAVPQMPEQEANARRAEELGLARRLDPDRVTSGELAAAVEEVAADESIRANLRVMQRVIGSCGGAVAGADAIEAHVTRPRRPRAGPVGAAAISATGK